MKFCLSPRAGYTDPAFRALCGKYGAEYAITEMVSAEGIIRGNTDETLEIIGKIPTGVQLFGANPKNMLKAAELFEKSKFKEININAGCPVRKVVKKGAGSGLLKNKENLYNIIEEIAGSIRKPLSVKMRLGFKINEGIEIAKGIERAGASSIIVHARTAVQHYSGKANWKAIKEIKDNTSVPIFGNGDIKNWEDAYRMMKETKCDGVYIGRAAKGDPFIFKEIKEKKTIERNWKNIQKVFLEYYKIREKYKVYSNPLIIIALVCLKGFKDAKKIRREVIKAKTEGEIVDIFKL